MPSFFNPAANLTANRIPYAAGGGRLSDTANLTFNGTVFEYGAVGGYGMRLDCTDQTGYYYGPNDTQRNLSFKKAVIDATHHEWGISHRDNNTDLWFYSYNGSTYWNALKFLAGATKCISVADKLLVGANSDALNGAMQLASHTSSAGGFGFSDFSLYREGAAAARLNAKLRVNDSTGSGALGSGALVVDGGASVGGAFFVGSGINAGGDIHTITTKGFYVAGNKIVGDRRTGWTMPTGAVSRATFATNTVTVEQLAQRFYALLQDLGITVGGHGLLDA